LAQGRSWMEAEAFLPTPPGVRTPKRPARSKSLYRPTTDSNYNANVRVFEVIF
jgi:hypothetical protein